MQFTQLAGLGVRSAYDRRNAISIAFVSFPRVYNAIIIEVKERNVLLENTHVAMPVAPCATRMFGICCN